VLGQIIDKQGRDIVDTEKRFVEAIEGKSELSVAIFPCGKFGASEHSTVKMTIGRKGSEIYVHKDVCIVTLLLK